MKINIFYSYQSDFKKFNDDFLTKIIEDCINKMNEEYRIRGIELVFQKSTRNYNTKTQEYKESPGARNISDELQRRIQKSDVFIGDVTTINKKTFLQRFNIRKFRPSSNNNVIFETGVALNSKSECIFIYNEIIHKFSQDKIALDLNLYDVSIIYKYNNNSNYDENYSEVSKKILNKLGPTIEAAISKQKSKIRPFLNFNDWQKEKYNSGNSPFITSSKYDSFKLELDNSISLNKTNPKPTRILGLSGLGKTRSIYNYFENTENNKTRKNLFYCDCNTSYFTVEEWNKQLDEFIQHSKESEFQTILILDNCDLDVHRRFTRKINNSNIIFISIYNDPTEQTRGNGSDTNYIELKSAEFKETISEFIEKNTMELEKSVKEQIISLSSGNFQMAKLLIDVYNKQTTLTGRIEDTELFEKLIQKYIGEGSSGEDNKRFIQSSSLFNAWGFKDEVKTQFKLIATNQYLTPVRKDDIANTAKFNKLTKDLIDAGIYEVRGRFISMRPTPLALHFAEKWFRNNDCHMPEVVELLDDKENHLLANEFCKQIDYLGYVPEAILMVERLLSPNSNFLKADILNTDFGARLIRSFSIINPTVASKYISNYLQNFIDLSQFIDGRRYTVWALEKLCFLKDTFEESSKSLLLLAMAENETWGNNATNQFTHLFKILLPGTEADLVARFEMLEYISQQEDLKYQEILIKALYSALEVNHFSRDGRMSEFGLENKEDFEPSRNECCIYWGNIFKLLKKLYHNEEFKLKDKLEELLVKKFQFYTSGVLFNHIFSLIQEIAIVKKYEWDNLLDSISYIIKNGRNIGVENYNKLEELKSKLTHKDFYRYFSNPYLFEEKDYRYDTERFTELANNAYKLYTDEDIQWSEQLGLLFYTNQYKIIQSYFGKKLAIEFTLTQQNRFIDQSLQFIHENVEHKDRNYELLVNFILSADDKIIEDILNAEYTQKDHPLLFIRLITSVDILEVQLGLIKHFVSSYSLNSEILKNLCNGTTLGQISPQQWELILNLIEEHQVNGQDIAMQFSSIIFHYASEEKKKGALELFKKYIFKQPNIFKDSYSFNYSHWIRHINDILEFKHDAKFAIYIHNQIIKEISGNAPQTNDDLFQSIYIILFKDYFDDIWIDFKSALLSSGENYLVYFKIKHILQANNSNTRGLLGPLFYYDANYEKLINYAEDDEKLQARIASMCPVFAGDNDDYANWSPYTLKLINKYGKNTKMLDALNANMNSFGWTGSTVPYYRSLITLLSQLKNHQFKEVKSWAKKEIENLERSIKNETIRDHESFL